MSHPCDDAFDQSWLDLVWADYLGISLASAGALCAAFWLGSDAQAGWQAVSPEPQWVPGCGREAPR